jgi:hypothetical protein
MMRRLVAAAAALLVLAACSSGSDEPSSAAITTTTGTGEESAYVDAVYDGLIAETPAAAPDDLRCVAQAIVDGVGVGRFHDAGLTVGQVRDPDFEPPASIADAMDTADRVAMATDLQSCGIGRVIGASVVGSFGSLTGELGDRARRCFARGFEGPTARRMIAGLMLNDVSLVDSSRLAGITVDCVGLAPLVANAAELELTAAESGCIDRAGRTDTTFLRLLADQFRNVPSTAKTAQARLGAQVYACLTPAHRVALAQRA